MKNNKNKILEVLLFVIVFLFFFVFFYRIHPIMLLDTDDWYYSFFSRGAYPIIGAWNPTKVLPEIFMPFCLTTGIRFLSLFSNNYLDHIMLINAFVVSIFISIYVFSFYRLIKNKFKLNNVCNYLIIILFIALHFLILKKGDDGNYYMFHAVDACCYYNYVIPNMICCSLVMYYFTHESFSFKDNVYKSGFMIFVMYLTLLSNFYSNIILATYLAFTLLIKIVNTKLLKKKNFNKKNILSFMKKNNFEIIFLVIWFILHLVELTGGRAKDLASVSENGYFNAVGQVIRNSKITFDRVGLLFIILFVLSLLVGNYFIFKNKLYKNKKVMTLISSFIISTIYIVLVSGKVGTYYLTRPEVFFVIVFYIFMFMCFVIAYLLKNYKKTFILFPIFVLIVVFELHVRDCSYVDSNYASITFDQNMKINERIIEQIVANEGQEGAVIYIPYFEHEINWPIPLKDVDRIPYALYKHGIIKKYTKFDFQISKEYYEDILGITSKKLYN